MLNRQLFKVQNVNNVNSSAAVLSSRRIKFSFLILILMWDGLVLISTDMAIFYLAIQMHLK